MHLKRWLIVDWKENARAKTMRSGTKIHEASSTIYQYKFCVDLRDWNSNTLSRLPLHDGIVLVLRLLHQRCLGLSAQLGHIERRAQEDNTTNAPLKQAPALPCSFRQRAAPPFWCPQVNVVSLWSSYRYARISQCCYWCRILGCYQFRKFHHLFCSLPYSAYRK